MLTLLLSILASAFLLGEGGENKMCGSNIMCFIIVMLLDVAFITNPQSVVVFLNSTAEFRCQHSADDMAMEWRINGTRVSVNHPPEITIQGGNPCVLSLVATSEYNGTVFDCVADSLNSNMSEISQNVSVLIQGIMHYHTFFLGCIEYY